MSVHTALKKDWIEGLMKIIYTALLLFLLTGSVFAQALENPSDAPGITVVEKSWRKEVRYPALEEDPLRPNTEQLELERARRQTQAENAVRARLGLPQLPPPTRVPSMPDNQTDNRPVVEYIYKARVNNTGTKAIRKLVWEYVFFDPATQKEVGRRRHESKVNIRPGKSTNLVG